MAIYTINITGSDPTTGALTFSPAEYATLIVVQGDTVNWVIAPNSGVSAITKISEKQPGGLSTFDLFNPDPHQIDPTTWQGIVNPNIGTDEAESYYITWTTAGSGWLNGGGGVPKTFDPKIKINPINPM